MTDSYNILVLQGNSQKLATNKIYFLLSIRKPKKWINRSFFNRFSIFSSTCNCSKTHNFGPSFMNEGFLEFKLQGEYFVIGTNNDYTNFFIFNSLINSKNLLNFRLLAHKNSKRMNDQKILTLN